MLNPFDPNTKRTPINHKPHALGDEKQVQSIGSGWVWSYDKNEWVTVAESDAPPTDPSSLFVQDINLVDWRFISIDCGDQNDNIPIAGGGREGF